MARKILLADDSVTAQNMGRKILADAGYEVITVNNGSAALKKIGEQHPDVIVLDVYMPGYSGLEVCQRLKEGGETARIPILLTVGKLEPFKPEEAKRVRADAFIVKPFEASELLSALTKLEDKIVHHAESSKPGRFGRATAAIDSSYDKTMAIKEDEGWKSRISFPNHKKEKTEQEEPVESDAAKPQAAAALVPAPVPEVKPTEQERVDLGALAPAGFPKDVTPEEIAALAAAAARVKSKFAEEKAAELPVISPVAEKQEERAPEPPAAAAPLPTVQSMAGPGPLYVPEQKPEAKQSKPVRESAPVEPPAPPATPREIKSEEKPAEVPSAAARLSESAPPAEEPVTMAAAPVTESSSPRWTAIPVALAPEDSAVSLEQEMRKAFAASAGVDSSKTISVSSAAAAEMAPTPFAPAPERESAKPRSVFEPTPAAATESVPAVVSEQESRAASFATPASATLATATAAAPETSVVPEAAPVAPARVFEEPGRSEPTRIEQLESPKAEEPAVAETSSSEAAIDKAAPVIEERAREVDAQRSSREDSEATPEPRAQTPDLSAVAEAALASFKPGHASQGNGSSGDSSKHDLPDPDAPVAVPLDANTSADKPKLEDETDPDVASIVDSVLANLRPKIVQEISRKLGKK